MVFGCNDCLAAGVKRNRSLSGGPPKINLRKIRSRMFVYFLKPRHILSEAEPFWRVRREALRKLLLQRAFFALRMAALLLKRQRAWIPTPKDTERTCGTAGDVPVSVIPDAGRSSRYSLT